MCDINHHTMVDGGTWINIISRATYTTPPFIHMCVNILSPHREKSSSRKIKGGILKKHATAMPRRRECEHTPHIEAPSVCIILEVFRKEEKPYDTKKEVFIPVGDLNVRKHVTVNISSSLSSTKVKSVIVSVFVLYCHFENIRTNFKHQPFIDGKLKNVIQQSFIFFSLHIIEFLF